MGNHKATIGNALSQHGRKSLCLETLTQWVEILLIWSKSAQKAEWGTVTELKKQTLVDFVGQKIDDFL